MNQTKKLLEAFDVPLAKIDVSDPLLYQQDAWRPFFKRLREEAPVHYLDQSPFGPFWSVTKFADIVAVDSNHRDFSSEPIITLGDQPEDLAIENFIAMDPPKHDEHRAAVQSAVSPKNLSDMESQIRARAVKILESLPVGETFDWVDKVSIEYTTQMLVTLFDFPFESRHKLTYWSDLVTGDPGMTGGTCSEEERKAGLMDCIATFASLWEKRKQEGSKDKFDLISLLQSNPNTANMIDNPMQFLGTLALLIVGGNDTTRNSSTGGVLALNENPVEYNKLRNNPSLISSMVPEIIRWQTPLTYMRRVATRDVELGGELIKKGDKVVMWYISGNRDESVIEKADDFIIDRKNPRHHLSFGFGVHRCMGNRLAEMQLRILWEEILQRFSFVEVVGSPERVHSNIVRGYSSLPVKLHPL
ncbi:cytochrome P450 [Zhongshania antarctica]|uniref:Cytochrome P450 n=1 Tax=Zhongshania antarctica TaxID=641702 RepID=A0A840R9G5_9GAMM|nr:cytochrome P450 [Zhongshania antarctica]MBB5188990.1 cytochrome P450 [Zhongshania antarctica]